MKKIKLERFENQEAVLTMDDGKTMVLSTAFIPSDAKKGDYLRLEKDMHQNEVHKKMMSERLRYLMENEQDR